MSDPLNFVKTGFEYGTGLAKNILSAPFKGALDIIKEGVNRTINWIGGTTRSAISSLLKGAVNIGANMPLIPASL